MHKVIVTQQTKINTKKKRTIIDRWWLVICSVTKKTNKTKQYNKRKMKDSKKKTKKKKNKKHTNTKKLN